MIDRKDGIRMDLSAGIGCEGLFWIVFLNRIKKEIKSLLFVLVFSLLVSQCDGGCAEVDSMTEAVAGEGFLLGCISCKKREEVSAHTTVDWHFRATGEETFRHIFHYEHPTADVLHPDFRGRLVWFGTPDRDVQIGAVYLENVTYNDTGTYRCTFHRTLFLRVANQHVTVTKEVELTVVAVANRELTAVIAEILMYVLIVVLQLWLIVVLIYCYKKTWDEHEAREERRALRAQKEALLESSDISPDGVQLDEHLDEH
ncbi:sodium channel subunit beta-1 [Gouania willdenowi]|uniref:Sodium channel regulatory subunit beta-3 n=1 Tax=Gouania willdenowi TaxID=441366 RepID=A0A8C5DCM0_GOUWI|nr:sodium channel subunit beta-1-like [Gouania willdenowi]